MAQCSWLWQQVNMAQVTGGVKNGGQGRTSQLKQAPASPAALSPLQARVLPLAAWLTSQLFFPSPPSPLPKTFVSKALVSLGLLGPPATIFPTLLPLSVCP